MLDREPCRCRELLGDSADAELGDTGEEAGEVTGDRQVGDAAKTAVERGGRVLLARARLSRDRRGGRTGECADHPEGGEVDTDRVETGAPGRREQGIDALPARRAGTLASAPTFDERIAEFFAALSPRTLALSGAAAALVIVLQAGVIGGILLKGGFETASVPANTPVNGSYALIRFQPQATAADIASFLAANKLSIVDGPSGGGGLYRVRVAETKLAKPELTDIVNKLQNDKVIGFIAATE